MGTMIKPIKTLSELNQKLREIEYNLTKYDIYNIPIVVRDPDCKAYYEVHPHVATMGNKHILVLDLNEGTYD